MSLKNTQVLCLVAVCAIGIWGATGCAHQPTAHDKSVEGVEVAVREVFETVRSGPVFKEDWMRYCEELMTAQSRSEVHECSNARDDSGVYNDKILRIRVNLNGDTARAEVDVESLNQWDRNKFDTVGQDFQFEEGRWRIVVSSSFGNSDI